MSTVKRLMHDSRNVGYFEDLSKGVQEIVKELIIDAANDSINVEIYKRDEDAIDSVECHSRDGFIPHSFNRGGIQYTNFTDLSSMWGSGCYPTAERSNDKAQAAVDESLQHASETFFENNRELLNKLGITIAQCSYSEIQELEEKNSELKYKSEELADLENEFMSGEQNSVMFNLRFMYHGKSAKGLHSASVSAALNFEAPYHRPGRQEFAKEIEITWRNVSELKRKLRLALKKTTKEVF